MKNIKKSVKILGNFLVQKIIELRENLQNFWKKFWKLYWETLGKIFKKFMKTVLENFFFNLGNFGGNCRKIKIFFWKFTN